MLCPDCFRYKNLEIEMDHMASFASAKDSKVRVTDEIEYEEWCPRCGSRFEGILERTN
jgi:hypothetical protein